MKKIFVKIIILIAIIRLIVPSQAYSAETKTLKAHSYESKAFSSLDFEYYNQLPGSNELNLFNIERTKEKNSIGIISPDMTKMVYSEVDFYPSVKQTASRLYIVDIYPPNTTRSKAEPENLFSVKSKHNIGKVIMETGMDYSYSEVFATLTVIDWSFDSKRILIKETLGNYGRGIWAAKLYVYDFTVQKVISLDTVRKAVIYYWKTQKGLYLNDYRWDIVPLGWDKEKPDEIIVNAYGYNYGTKQFLGCWSIDYKGTRTKLLSLSNENRSIGKYGLILKSDEKKETAE